MGELLEDPKSLVKKIIEDASTELEYKNQKVLDILTQYVEDGTIIGLKSGRIKKMSDSILASLRKEGDEDED